MNYSILAHTCILNLLKNVGVRLIVSICKQLLNLQYFLYTIAMKFGLLFSVELHESNILLYLLKLFVEDILVF